jgi:UDP-GlcNAc:undecaprenyl-phosphate GlcNAc-1-phosphate transferase
MNDILWCLCLSFIVTRISIPVILTIAKEKKLVDLPNDRKIHKTPIPSLGGVGIFGGFTLGCIICTSFAHAQEFQFFMAAALVVFFFGLKDDILIISPVKKLCGQLMAAFLIVYKGGLRLSDFYGVFNLNTGNPVYGFILTFLSVIVIMNAFNLIDGIDGLATTLGLMVSIFFGIYFLKTGFISYAVLSFSLTGSLAAFLYFNFHPAKIFMGDAGSQLIGMVSAILVLKFIITAPVSPAWSINSSPALGFSVLLIPLLDTLRVFVIRIRKRKSPFMADRSHIHHILLDKGLSQRNISFILLVFNVLNVMLVYLNRSIGNGWLIFFMSLCYFGSVKILLLLPVQKKVQYVAEIPLYSDGPEPDIKTITKTTVIVSKSLVE